jgi:2-oxoisovalerate dehydrogenase E1 component
MTLLTIGRRLRPLVFQSRGPRSPLRCAISSTSAWDPYEASHGENIRELNEVKAVQDLLTFLKQEGGSAKIPKTNTPEDGYKHTLTPAQYKLALDAAMATFSLSVHARIASMVGHGFYTIGPCGEELLSSAALAFRPEDATALHYRHTGMSIARQMAEHPERPMEDILLARARGYTVSKHDPVTGGVHCSIGDGPNEYLVTSTLSSQCPAAVGRALGYSLLQPKQKGESPISYTTIGDGSLHNHHFLSSLTLARHAKHMKVKCP